MVRQFVSQSELSGVQEGNEFLKTQSFADVEKLTVKSNELTGENLNAKSMVEVVTTTPKSNVVANEINETYNQYQKGVYEKGLTKAESKEAVLNASLEGTDQVIASTKKTNELFDAILKQDISKSEIEAIAGSLNKGLAKERSKGGRGLGDDNA